MTKQVWRLVDGSFAVCEVERFGDIGATPSPCQDWQVSTIQRARFRVVSVLPYKGYRLSEASEQAAALGLL